MKYIFPFLLTLIVWACGAGAAEIAARQRRQDSISAARIDSINTERIEELRIQYLDVDSAKNEIDYDAVLVRLDSLTEFNDELDEKLIKGTSDVSKLKGEIGKILTHRTLTLAESTKVKSLIERLSGKVDGLVKELKKL
jgi:hypothetical protein